MAKLERRLTTNQEIAGSSPARLALFGTKSDILLYFIYIMEHFFSFFLGMDTVCELRDARVANSKTCFTPSPVFAEHSIYPYAPILSAIHLPSSSLIGDIPIFESSSVAFRSPLRSTLHPTNKNGTS